MTNGYAAGLFDGEGTIYIDKNLSVRLEVQMAERALPTLKNLQQTYGGKVKPCRPESKTWAASWRWTQWSEEAGETLRQLLPHLQIKRPQAELALELLAVKIKNKQVKWTPDARAKAEAMRSQMLELNRKGPRIAQAA